MSPSQQTAWTTAVNDCSARLESEESGTVEEQARITEFKRAVAASAVVKAALRTYVGCMDGGGFTVSGDPFHAPAAVMNAEDGTSAAAAALRTRYNAVWSGCVAPYQKVYDEKMFGSG